jgi:DNA-binding CsgD family transcriptional regulator/tetratricopeptide (TPR) repeat protein
VETTLLEREAELAVLRDVAREASRGVGSVVLVSGEAGIGKSSLVAELPGVVPGGGRVLVGWCDDLATPRVLGPLRDLVGRVGPALADAVRSTDRSAVLDAIRDELDAAPGPTVLVVEDVHWADEATLDVLRFLLRRMAALHAVLVLTYRDDEVPSEHPLRQVLGLASRVVGVRRLRLARLSPAAVRRLGQASDVDPDRLFGVTSGNPYFVTEVLAAGDSEAVPLTIADAVGARLAHLDPSALAAVEQLAVIPSAAEQWLVEAVLPGPAASAVDALVVAEERGLLAVTPGRVAFRHELTRRAVVDTMPAARRVAANRRVLEALLDRPDAELSRVVHHADQAGDRDAVLTHGPRAAAEAIAAGAHRQAAAHLRLVLDHDPDLEPDAEADLWESFAVESYTVDAPSAEVLQAQLRAVVLRRQGDSISLGASLRWLSRIAWWAGAPEIAGAAADEAVERLTGTGDPDALAMALSNQAQLHALAGRDQEAVALCAKALAMSGISPATRSHLLNNRGLALIQTGDSEGYAALQESLRVALDAGEPEHACRAYVNLAWLEVERLNTASAEELILAGIEFADRSEFLTFGRYLHLELGMLRFTTSHWDEVLPAAASALDGSPPIRCSALTLIGRTRARRGEPGADELLHEAWELAVQVGECQRIGPAASALAEAAELNGDAAAAREVVESAYRLAQRHGTTAVRAELAYRMGQVGTPVGGNGIPHPYALLADGRWREAAQRWRESGCRYEAALARTSSTDPHDLLEALAELDELGAEPLARSVRATLRLMGVAKVPRGPLPSTRDNPSGLTQRQSEVAQLVVQGMTNAEIAAHLVVSIRTVDSHVAAILGKLGTRSRRELVTRAAELGVLG